MWTVVMGQQPMLRSGTVEGTVSRGLYSDWRLLVAGVDGLQQHDCCLDAIVRLALEAGSIPIREGERIRVTVEGYP
jgi:hypothetical protein